jgi:hypothetical protein
VVIAGYDASPADRRVITYDATDGAQWEVVDLAVADEP